MSVTRVGHSFCARVQATIATRHSFHFCHTTLDTVFVRARDAQSGIFITARGSIGLRATPATRWPSWAFPNPYWAQDTRRFEYKWAWIPDTTAAARPTRWRRTSECLWDMKWAVWDDSLNVQTPHLGRPVNGCMSPYGCIRTRRHPWQPPDEASAKMPWFRSLVALRDRPPIPGVWCPCKQQCQCASCSDARAESLGLKCVVESDGADGVARLVAL